MKLILNNGKEYEVVSVFGKNKIINDKEREYIEILIDLENSSIDEINNDFSNEENTNIITLIDKIKEETYIHKDYIILDEISIKDYVISKETNNKEQEIKKMISVGLGRTTFSEKLILENKRDLEDITIIIGDLLGGIL